MTFPAKINNPALGIALILIAICAISINDMLIKFLSGGYPLHQMVFTRSVIGILFSLIIVQLEGGWSILHTRTPYLHLLRGLLIVVANLTFLRHSPRFLWPIPQQFSLLRRWLLPA